MKESRKEVNVIDDEDEEDDTLMEYFNKEGDTLWRSTVMTNSYSAARICSNFMF
jgi:hypothetical protein